MLLVNGMPGSFQQAWRELLYFGNGPLVVHQDGAVLDASGVGLEVWQGQLPLVVEHALSPPTVTLPMSPVQTLPCCYN